MQDSHRVEFCTSIRTYSNSSVEAAIIQSGVDDNVTAKACTRLIGAVNCAKMPPQETSHHRNWKLWRSLQVMRISLCFQLTREGSRRQWTEQVMMRRCRRCWVKEHIPTNWEGSHTITGEEDECPVDGPETVWSTLWWPVHAVEKLGRQGPITIRAIQGAQTGCCPLTHCVLCDLPHLPAVQISQWCTGSSGRTNQLQCEELKGLCWVYRDTGVDEERDLSIVWCSISVYLHSNIPGCPGSSSETRRWPIDPRKNGPVSKRHCGSVNPVPECHLSVI